MRFFFLTLFLLSLSCSTPFSKVERIYICGDHPCKNDKEAKEYFNNKKLESKNFTKQIAFNAIPHIDIFLENG